MMYILRITLIPLLFFCFLPGESYAQPHPRADTLYIPETLVIPVIDGLGDDSAWELVDWQPIDQIWMPYGNDPDNIDQAGLEVWGGPDDFTGNFKIVWSSETNLLYFLVEIIDDVFVDGYVYSQTNGSYPNYDIVEVFIDEDRSGGPHVFDGVLFPPMSNCPTCNAENAFSYHLAANAPEDGGVETEFYALDIWGSNWQNHVANYASHLPEFALRKDGTKYTWEFSLIVHDDTYNHQNQEASVVELAAGKVMGLSMAYCDNDKPTANPLRRNHFFGSVEVPFAQRNSHWENADWFGVAELTENPGTTGYAIPANESRLAFFVRGDELVGELRSSHTGQVNTRIVSMLGEVLRQETVNKDQELLQHQISLSGLPRGVYLLEMVHGDARHTMKFLY